MLKVEPLVRYTNERSDLPQLDCICIVYVLLHPTAGWELCHGDLSIVDVASDTLAKVGSSGARLLCLLHSGIYILPSFLKESVA